MTVPPPVKEEPKPTPVKKNPNDVDCLLVSCSELVPVFTYNLKLKCDESFLEESAINSINRSMQRQLSGEGSAYKFIFVDLDDPTLMLGRFMVSLGKILQGTDIKITVFATASTSSDRMLKKCEEVKVKFIPKPIFETKLRYVLKPFLS
jgi:CheY-like chemotaxis protein